MVINPAKILSVFIFYLGLTLACSDGKDDGHIRFGLDTAPVNLDPRFATDAVSSRIARLLYRQLIDFNDAYQVIPSLARWDQLGPMHYRFYLQDQGRLFHDGSKLTAADVKATFDFVLDPANMSPLLGGLSVIARITVFDRDTVDFYLKKEDPFFTSYLGIGIVKAKLIANGHDFKNQPLGSGAFAFHSWPYEGRLLLKRLKDNQVIEFITVKEPVVRVLKLLRGELDIIQNALNPELVDYLQQKDGIDVRFHPGSNFTYLGLNLEDSALSRIEVRKAIAHAIDRDAILTHLWGQGARAAQSLLTPSHWAGHKGLLAYEYNPKLAREYLAKVGYNQKRPLRLLYKTSSNPYRIRLATVLQHQLNQAGFEVDLRSYDWATLYGDIKAGNFQIFSLSWVAIKSPDMFRNIFHSRSIPPVGANRGRYRSVLADRLIEKSLSQQDWKLQRQTLASLQEVLLDELPYIPLWYENHVAVSRTNIKAYRLAVDGNFDALAEVIRD